MGVFFYCGYRVVINDLRMSNSMDDINRCAPITLRDWFNLNPNRKNGTYYIGHHFFHIFLVVLSEKYRKLMKISSSLKMSARHCLHNFRKKKFHICVSSHFEMKNSSFNFRLMNQVFILITTFLAFFLLYLKKSWKKKNTQRANKRLKYVEYSND